MNYTQNEKIEQVSDRMAKTMYKYYKFDDSDAVAKRESAYVYLLDDAGNWVEKPSLLRKFIGEISEKEAELIVQQRKAKL